MAKFTTTTIPPLDGRPAVLSPGEARLLLSSAARQLQDAHAAMAAAERRRDEVLKRAALDGHDAEALAREFFP